MSKAYIYALCDPVDLSIHYVGQTWKPRDRYKAHISPANKREETPKSAWVRSLAERGRLPVMVVLDVIPYNWKEALKYESAWIDYLKRTGHDLTNEAETTKVRKPDEYFVERLSKAFEGLRNTKTP